MIVILPMSTPVTLPEKPVVHLASECAMPTASRGHRILVVDDEQHIRDILAETLRDAGYAVETASNGEEGVLKLRSGSFDLILLDIRMPIHSGLDVLKLLRRNGGGPPVVIITGLASSEEMEEALRLGAAKCIRKPFHLKTLLSDISGILHSGRPATTNHRISCSTPRQPQHPDPVIPAFWPWPAARAGQARPPWP
jgi:DNA-binding response OmpR family regulator